MINVLLENTQIDAPWLYGSLKKYIKPNFRVAVVALSFKENRVRNLEDWDALYSKENGKYYGSIAGGLLSYGIQEENISFLNWFKDTKETAARTVEMADIVYFLGGLPDRMMERIRALELYDVLLAHNGIAMGYSAGALVQLAEYHLSPDTDYPRFTYQKGIPYLHGFYLEVHYEGTEEQNASIERVLAERGKTVYATAYNAGAILIDHGTIELLGDVQVFRK